MGRKKSDSPTLFPWDKIFSDDDNTFNEGLEYCKSEYSGSETVKRAVTAIGSGYNSGSKPVLCDRIKLKANQIRYQLDKVQNEAERERLREKVILYYKQTFLKKFEGKEPGIINIMIPARPNLPLLNEQEKSRFVSPPSSPRSSPPSSPRSMPRSMPDVEIEEEIDIPPPRKPLTDQTLLSARALVYYKNIPLIDNKKNLSAKAFYEQMMELYSGIVPEDSVLISKDAIKQEIAKIPSIVKSLGSKLNSEVKLAEKLINESLSKYKKNISIEIEEDVDIPPPRKVPVQQKEYVSTISEDEIINYIRTKGWDEPKFKSKEALCDYVLTKIRKEDSKEEKEYKAIENRIDKLSTDLLTLIEMQEERIKELEKAKSSKGKKKVSFGPDQIRYIEEEVDEIKEQIDEVKTELKEAKEQKEILEEKQEEKRQMCFRMRKWLDEDEFSHVDAEKDLACDTGVCNVDSGVCEPSQESDYTTTIGIAKIKGSKSNVDRIKSKYDRIPNSQLKEQIKQILSTSDLEVVTTKDVLEQLNMLYNTDLNDRKKEIRQLVQEETKRLLAVEEPVDSFMSTIHKSLKPDHGLVPHTVYNKEITEKDIVEKTVEVLERSGKKIVEIDIRDKVGQELGVEITPYKAIIKTTIKKFVEDMKLKRKKCNTIPLDRDVDEITRANDLMCDNGDICNLDESRCDPVEEITEPIEELTIGGMLVKVAGKNKIIEALRQKIIKSGGAIPVEEPEDVQTEEEKYLNLGELLSPIQKLRSGIKPQFENDDDLLKTIKDISLEDDSDELLERLLVINNLRMYHFEDIIKSGNDVLINQYYNIVKKFHNSGDLAEDDYETFTNSMNKYKSSKEPVKPLAEVIEESANDVFASVVPGVRIDLSDLIKNIKSITKSTGVPTAQNKIKSAEKRCIDRIAKCAGIKI